MSGSKQASAVAMEAKGVDEIRSALTNLLDSYDMHEQTILSFLVNDEKAAVHHRSKMKFKPTGEVFDTEMLDLWKLRGDKIISVIEFVDTATRSASLAADEVTARNARACLSRPLAGAIPPSTESRGLSGPL